MTTCLWILFGSGCMCDVVQVVRLSTTCFEIAPKVVAVRFCAGKSCSVQPPNSLFGPRRAQFPKSLSITQSRGTLGRKNGNHKAISITQFLIGTARSISPGADRLGAAGCAKTAEFVRESLMARGRGAAPSTAGSRQPQPAGQHLPGAPSHAGRTVPSPQVQPPQGLPGRATLQWL